MSSMRPSLRSLVCLAAMAVAASASARPATAAEDASAPAVTFGGFVDTYYAWDAQRPVAFDRAYTTQAVRHAEFNVNLAFVEARLVGPRTRGRFAIQSGTAVQSNYAGEPRNGAISGPDVSRAVQEATVGWRVSPTLWVDGGIFPAHVGYESWISRDNITYTRSLVAEYSPYYESGARLTWTPSSVLTAQAVLVNGWQNISAENSSPGAGVRVDWTPRPGLVLTYDDLFADMAPDTSASHVRAYHDVLAQWDPTPRWRLATALSLGTQAHSAADGGGATWGGGVLMARWQVSAKVALTGRVEGFSDPDQVVLVTGVDAPFRSVGASFGVDVSPEPSLRWRTEIRAFGSRDAVWPEHESGRMGTRAGFVVTSLSLTL